MPTITCPDCKRELAVKKCLNCRHYAPQYVEENNRYVRTQFGICKFPQIKPRKDDGYCACWDGK